MARRYYNQYGAGPDQKKGFSPDQIRTVLIKYVIPGIIIGAMAWVLIFYWASGKLGLGF